MDGNDTVIFIDGDQVNHGARHRIFPCLRSLYGKNITINIFINPGVELNWGNWRKELNTYFHVSKSNGKNVTDKNMISSIKRILNNKKYEYENYVIYSYDFIFKEVIDYIKKHGKYVEWIFSNSTGYMPISNADVTKSIHQELLNT